MSTQYYHHQWESAISGLLECVEEQNMPLEENRNDKGSVQITYKKADYEWFQYYAQLYLKYLDVYRKLEDSYDQTVHPQKRILMKEMLQNSIVRMCEVKQLLIRYSTQTNIIQSDYINIDEILMEMKLQPKALKVPIPRYYREIKTERDKILKQMVEVMKVPEQIQVFNQDITLQANFDTIIRIIQKIERGRQGIVLGLDIAKAKKKMLKQRGPQLENQDNNRANAIQKYWRAFLSRRQFSKMRAEELKFLGIEKQPVDKNLLMQAELNRKKIKLTQTKREKDFENQKVNIQNNIIRTEEKIIKGKMQDERRKWINKFLQIHEFGNLPNNLTQFYKLKQKNNEVTPPAESKKDKKPDAKSAKKNDVEKFLDEHVSIGPSESVVGLQKTIQSYSTTWASKSCSSVDGEYFDVDLAKSQIRPQIEAEMEKNVDALISLELDCMRIKYGIKKKKQKKKKNKKKKAKKVKIPQGLGKRNPKDILEQLFEDNIAKVLSQAKMEDFIGDHNCLTHILQKTAETMPEPSMSQVRNMVSEYIGIPLGSQNAKQKLEKWNWFMFYGPTGTGKTLVTRALQTQTNALVFDISPDNIKSMFTEKSEITKLIWSVIICAKHFQPSIIIIEDFQTIIPAAKGKKKTELTPSFGPKMKKAIVDMKKNKLWVKQDRIAVIAQTNKPYDGSMKQMKKLFDKKIYFPYPNYPTRKLILKNLIESKLGHPLAFNYNTLAHTTQGFTAGSYNQCVKKVLTPNRIARLKDDPLKMSQFIIPLSNTICVFSEQFDKLKKFTDQVTGLKSRRQAKNQNSKKQQNKKDVKKKK